MRIQLKSDALDEKDKKDKEKTEDGSTAEESRPESEAPTSGAQTPLPEASSSTAPSSSEITVVEPLPEPEGGHVKQKTGRLVGMINNLITSDMDELTIIYNLLFMREFSYLHIVMKVISEIFSGTV